MLSRRSPIVAARTLAGCRAAIALLGMLAIAPTRAAAEPINSDTTTFTAYCTGLGDVTAVAVFFPSALARGATSAFHVVGSNTVLIWYTKGTDRLANQAGTSCEITSVNGEPEYGVVATFVTGGPVRLWNPAVDWKNFPDQVNPSPDSYGTPDVWRYMRSEGFAHDPNSYHLLPDYEQAGEKWTDAVYGIHNLFVEHSQPRSMALLMGAWGGRSIGEGRNAIVAWTSPVNGRLRIDGSVQQKDLTECALGDGAIWSIYRDTESLLQAVIPVGESTAFAFSTNVRRGEILYFVLD